MTLKKIRANHCIILQILYHYRRLLCFCNLRRSLTETECLSTLTSIISSFQASVLCIKLWYHLSTDHICKHRCRFSVLLSKTNVQHTIQSLLQDVQAHAITVLRKEQYGKQTTMWCNYYNFKILFNTFATCSTYLPRVLYFCTHWRTTCASAI